MTGGTPPPGGPALPPRPGRREEGQGGRGAAASASGRKMLERRARGPREDPGGVGVAGGRGPVAGWRGGEGKARDGLGFRAEVGSRLWAAGLYMTSAVALVALNKAALSSWGFGYPNVITLAQLTCSLPLLAIASRAGWVQLEEPLAAGGGGGEHVGDEEDGGSGKGRRARRRRNWLLVPDTCFAACLPISGAFLMYMLLGMASIVGVSLPMYTTLRKTAPAFTMTAEWLLQGRSHSQATKTGVAITCMGALLAGLNDLNFSLRGYGLVFASNVTTTAYLLVISQRKAATGLTSFGLMWCNGLICLPILLLVSAANGDLRGAWEFPHLSASGFLGAFLGSCILAFALNYAMFLNVTVNSPLTQTVCGNTKDLVVVALGYLAFNAGPAGALNVAGVALGLVGSGLFAWAKLTEVP